MAPDRNYDSNSGTRAMDSSSHGDSNANRPEGNIGGRPIFSLTMDPNALEHELDQAAQALHSTVNSLLNTMQSSVFGGLETLSKEMSAFEKNSKDYFEQHPLPGYHHHLQYLPWSFRTDGPKKRYRITIEELPPVEDDKSSSSKVFSTSSNSSNNTSTTALTKGSSGVGEDFTITQGKVGTPDEGKTVITASVAPGLLDWLLFTTHEDSFFRRLGHAPKAESEKEYDVVGGTKIQELSEAEQDGAQKKIVPALVEKVKQVGTSWEKDARHWWQRKRNEDEQAEVHGEDLDQRHHVLVGTSQSERYQDDERQSRRWPRGRSWGRTESFSQTTVTRPDGTVEHRTVNSVNGETETVIKIHHPDGSVEETVTRENQDHRGHVGWRERLAGRRRHQHESEEDRERDSVAAVVAEAIAAEKDATFAAERGHDEERQASEKLRNWPPKAWSRRQGRED